MQIWFCKHTRNFPFQISGDLQEPGSSAGVCRCRIVQLPSILDKKPTFVHIPAMSEGQLLSWKGGPASVPTRQLLRPGSASKPHLMSAVHLSAFRQNSMPSVPARTLLCRSGPHCSRHPVSARVRVREHWPPRAREALPTGTFLP